jgi:hypothetical protein
MTCFGADRRLVARGLQDASTGVDLDFYLKPSADSTSASLEAAITALAEGGSVGDTAASFAATLTSALTEEFPDVEGVSEDAISVEPPTTETITETVLVAPAASAAVAVDVAGAPPPEAGASAEAAADMLAALQDKIPVKNVQDDTVFTITDVSMYREEKYQFYPSNRYKKAEDGAVQSQQGSLLENFPSPGLLDLDVAMFILPLRTPLKKLCPVIMKAPPEKNNFIDDQHKDWRAVSDRSTLVTACDEIKAFDREGSCHTSDDLKAQFPDRYRAACSVDLAPAYIGVFNVSVPLNLKFAMTKKPLDKQDPEWYLDVQTLFSFGFERALLDVEEEFMGGSSSVEQTKGSMLWAGETYIRGRANCDPRFPECEMSMPANPPVLIPRITINVNTPRTMAVLNQLGFKPRHWPKEDEAIEELIQTRFAVGLSEAIRTAMSSEDASLTLKPRVRYIVAISIRIDPVYRMKSRYGSAMELNRWNFFVQGIDVKTMEMDYSRRSKCGVRVVFQIAESSTRQKEKFKFDLNDFMTSVGAWTGIWAIGLGLLNKWQSRTMPFGLATADEAYAYLEPKYAKLEKKEMKKIERIFAFGKPICLCCCGLRRKPAAKVAPEE